MDDKNPIIGSAGKCSRGCYAFHAGTDHGQGLSRFYREQVRGRAVLLVDDVRNTGQTLQRCAVQTVEAGGTVLATAQICDRLEAIVELGVPNVALAEYKAPENYPDAECPMCQAGQPITSF